jgi:hypothetical protein
VIVYHLHALLVLLVHKIEFLDWFLVNEYFENLKAVETFKLEENKEYRTFSVSRQNNI